jgi:malate synthase
MSLAMTTSDIEMLGRGGDADARVLTPDALAFVAELQRELDPIRRQLLAARVERRERIAAWRPPLATCSTGASSSPDQSIGRW